MVDIHAMLKNMKIGEKVRYTNLRIVESEATVNWKCRC
jgi:hypothetical protein